MKAEILTYCLMVIFGSHNLMSSVHCKNKNRIRLAVPILSEGPVYAVAEDKSSPGLQNSSISILPAHFVPHALLSLPLHSKGCRHKLLL